MTKTTQPWPAAAILEATSGIIIVMLRKVIVGFLPLAAAALAIAIIVSGRRILSEQSISSPPPFDAISMRELGRNGIAMLDDLRLNSVDRIQTGMASARCLR